MHKSAQADRQGLSHPRSTMSTSFANARAFTMSGLFAGYAPPAGVYDEMLASPGVLRPHWQPIVSALDSLGATELGRRWEQARRLIHENGITYNVYGDPQRTDRPWELDAVPLLFPAAAWTALAAGLMQRARLLNHILVDLYGPQRLLHKGLLPAELIYGNPGFLLPCHG